MKHVVITGSTRGIGLAMAMEFLKAGCSLTLSGRNVTMHDLPQLKDYPNQWHYVACDVQKMEDVEHLWKSAIDTWGKVDIWINNAGQNTPHNKVWDTNTINTSGILNTNILGMIYGSQVTAKGMLSQGFGAIYSMEGLGSNNMIQVNTILYGTTKHALTYFMKGLAKELSGTPVIAGRLSPGMMLTDFITKNLDGTPSEVLEHDNFKRIFNILADHPQPVAKYLVKAMLSNQKNDVQLAWLTNRKVIWRFVTSPFKKRRLL